MRGWGGKERGEEGGGGRERGEEGGGGRERWRMKEGGRGESTKERRKGGGGCD